MSQQHYQLLLPEYRWVVGVDEVGLGALAGPLYVTACLVHTSFEYAGLRDSKKKSEEWREHNYDHLVRLIRPDRIITEVRSAEAIDRKGVAYALQAATCSAVRHMIRLLTGMGERALFVMDGEHDMPVLPMVGVSYAWPKADTFVPAVMAAANLAKTQRDRYMVAIAREDERCGRYGFDQHKGYGSQEHLNALATHGIINEHRISYRPVKQAMYKGAVNL